MKCPHCGSVEGFYFVVYNRYKQLYDWNGEPTGTDDGAGFTGYEHKKRHCIDCHKPVTKLANKIMDAKYQF